MQPVSAPLPNASGKVFHSRKFARFAANQFWKLFLNPELPEITPSTPERGSPGIRIGRKTDDIA
jgi:hypothetical protein